MIATNRLQSLIRNSDSCYRLFGLFLIFSTLWFTPFSLAQSKTETIEKITVTAQKREQSTQDVAVSVSVLNEALIQRLHIKDTTVLSAQLPNVKITTNTGEGAPPVVNIRGVGSLDYNNTTTAPVAFYNDGVVGGSLSNSLLYLFDIEQVEVLKGPQGTLFGRNTTGGAVLLQSVRPKDYFEGYLTLGLADQDHRKFESVLNAPLGDKSAVRVGVSHQDYDYSSNNLLAGVPQAGMRQNNFKILLSHEADSFSYLFKVHGADWEGVVKPVHNKGVIKDVATQTLCSPQEAGSLNCTDSFGFNDGSESFHDVMVDNFSPHTTERIGGSGEIKWDINTQVYLTSITSINKLERIHTFNCDGSPADLCDGNLGVDNRTWTQELRVHVDHEQFYFIGGWFYIDENIDQQNMIDLFRDARAFLAAGPANFFYDNTVDLRSSSIFGQLDYSLDEDLIFTFGLRYTDDETEYRASSQINVPTMAGDFGGITVPGWNLTGAVSDSHLSGKVALVQKLNSSLSLFYSISEGFKSGGYNGSLAFSPEEAILAEYGPETLTAYEVGAKYINDVHRLEGALFYYDYQDQQVFMNQQSNEGLSAPAQVLDNVGQSELYGAELEWYYTPDNHWLWRLGIGYLPKAELDEFIDLRGNTISDNRLPFSSKWNLNGLVNYTFAAFDGDIDLQLEVDYQSAFYFDQNQNPYARQSDFALVNASVNYQSEKWRIALWGKNLFDQDYSQIVFDLTENFGLLQDLKGEARRVGVEVTYQF